MNKTTLPIINNNNIDIPDPADLLHYWNSKDNIGIKHQKPDSKVYKNSVEYIKILLSGQIRNRFELDEDFLADHGITIWDMTRNWTYDDVKEAIDRYNYMCSPQYAADKSYYPKNMPDFIYNVRTQRSFILSLLGDNRDVPGRPVKVIDIFVFVMYSRRLDMWMYEDDNEFVQSVNFVINQYKSYFNTIGKYSHAWETEKIEFFDLHINYVWQTLRDGEHFNPKWIRSTFIDYKEWLKRNFKNFHHKYFEISNQDISNAFEKYKREELRLKNIK